MTDPRTSDRCGADMMNGIGKREIEAMGLDGWAFSDCGARVANGWLVWAESPDGRNEFVLMADPDDEPEKFGQTELPKCDGVQMGLFEAAQFIEEAKE